MTEANVRNLRSELIITVYLLLVDIIHCSEYATHSIVINKLAGNLFSRALNNFFKII